MWQACVRPVPLGSRTKEGLRQGKEINKENKKENKV
jgi:hypothetical protein